MAGAGGAWDPVELLTSLVRIPSVNPMGRADLCGAAGTGEGALGGFLEAFFRDLEVRFERRGVLADRDNVLAWFDAPASDRVVLFDVHQDTVPTDGMTIDPYGAAVRGGRLYGRGACDVKGSMAAMLCAFARLVRERPEGAASVVLACTVDEEYTHTGSSALAADPPAERVDLAVVAEPTSLDLVVCHKGTVRWRIHSRGVACHSARPELGDNAIYRMGRVVSALERIAEELRGGVSDAMLGWPSLSVGTIAGGSAANIVPDRCTIEVDRRLIPGEGPDEARQRVIDRLAEEIAPGDFARLEFERPWVRMPALRPGLGAEVVERLVGAVARSSGRTPAIMGVPFGTDAGPLGEVGIPCVVFGPGSIDQAHTEDEWVELDQVRAAAECYFEIARASG